MNRILSFVLVLSIFSCSINAVKNQPKQYQPKKSAGQIAAEQLRYALEREEMRVQNEARRKTKLIISRIHAQHYQLNAKVYKTGLSYFDYLEKLAAEKAALDAQYPGLKNDVQPYHNSNSDFEITRESIE